MSLRFSIAEIQRMCPKAKIGGVAAVPASGAAPGKSWSAAQPTSVGEIKFPSKTQARVYHQLESLFGAERLRLDTRWPLLAGVKANGRVLYMSIDFCVVVEGKPKLWIDAKTKRKSRDWERGLAMFRQSWGEVVLWDGRAEVPAEVVQLSLALKIQNSKQQKDSEKCPT